MHACMYVINSLLIWLILNILYIVLFRSIPFHSVPFHSIFHVLQLANNYTKFAHHKITWGSGFSGMEWRNGMLEWNGGMERWNGMVEWTGAIEC